MPYCKDCRQNKKKVFFDIDKARDQAQLITDGKTQAIYKEGQTTSFTDLTTAIERGYDIIELVHFNRKTALV